MGGIHFSHDCQMLVVLLTFNYFLHVVDKKKGNNMSRFKSVCLVTTYACCENLMSP